MSLDDIFLECTGLFVCIIFLAIYKYIYEVSTYKARKSREAYKAYVKDYLKDI